MIGPVPGGQRQGRRDCGSGTLLVVAVIGFAGLLIAVTLASGQAMTARHRARAAADLAALAAAGVEEQGLPNACATATEVASRNRAVVTTCSIGPTGDVIVGVDSTAGRPLMFGLPPASAIAKAGSSPP